MKYLKAWLACCLLIACQNNSNTARETTSSIDEPNLEKPAPEAAIEDERDLKEAALDTLRQPYHYYYLSDLSLDSVGKMILSGDLQPLDNEITFRLLDTLKHVDEDQLDFYLAVFERILDQSDGALSEVLGGYCISFIYHQPEVFSDYLAAKDTNLIRKWAEFSVYEMYFRFPEDSLLTKCAELNQRLPNPDSLKEIIYFQDVLRFEAQNLLNSGY